MFELLMPISKLFQNKLLKFKKKSILQFLFMSYEKLYFYLLLMHQNEKKDATKEFTKLFYNQFTAYFIPEEFQFILVLLFEKCCLRILSFFTSPVKCKLFLAF